MRFTVLGGSGFIGQHVVAHLQTTGASVQAPERDALGSLSGSLGHVIYAIGLTGDFRSRPFDTVHAHVSLLAELLSRCDYESWLYLSSTRVYQGLPTSALADEQSALTMVPGNDSLYDLSKLTGEALCLALDNPRVRVARLSNVYGPGQSPHSFLGSVLDSLAATGEVTIGESAESSKDYLSIADAVRALVAIATQGRQRIYNVASGQDVTHRKLADGFNAIGKYKVRIDEQGPTRCFPGISIERLRSEFQFAPQNILQQLPALVRER